MAVNLSAQDLWHNDLISEVDQILEPLGLKGQHLSLEITESMLVGNIETTISLLNQLKERGIQISIDDFGTGYSSLSYLYQLPVNTLKIDRSFVNGMLENARNHKIVETIITLSEQLDVEVVAEGIETQQQMTALKQLGCGYAQGYFFSKPVSVDSAESLLLKMP